MNLNGVEIMKPDIKVDISVVIPVYKAEACLKELYRRLVESLESLQLTFEIIMIEDCGNDGSWNVIREIASQDHRLRGFKLSRNFGQHHAITAGLDQAKGTWTVIMDCDLQDKPEDIRRLIEKTHEGFDIVIARNVLQRDSYFKEVFGRIYYKIFSWLADYSPENGARCFRIISSDATQALKAMREQSRSINTLCIWMGFSYTYMDVETQPRFAGKSSYNIRQLLDRATQIIVAFSNKPLRISISVGFTMAGCSLIYAIYIFTKAAMYDIPVPGWSSLITSFYFIGGLILANLGIVGVYLGKTFDEMKGRPLYLIARRTDSEGSGDTKLLFLNDEKMS